MSVRYAQCRLYVCTAAITLVLGVILLRQYLVGGMPFTPQGVMSDLLRANLPAYTLYYDMITESMHFWSWSMGIGTSVFSHADIFFDPFTYICFVGGRDNIAYMMGWAFAIKIVLEAVSMAIYLNYFKLDKRAIVIVSIMYAFCGYSIIMGSNLALGTILVYAPLALLFIEKSFDQKKYFIGLTVILTLIGLCSYYYLYTFGIIALIYVIVRSKMKSVSIGKSVLFLALCGFATLLLIMPALLPQAELVLGNARSTNGKDVVLGISLLIPDFGTLFTIIARSFSISDLGMFENYVGITYNAGNDFFQSECFVSCIALPLCGLFVYKNKNIQRVTFSILLLILVACTIPLFSYVMNATITINYRWMFILHILLCLLTAFSIDYILKTKFSQREAMVTCFVSLGILLLSVSIVAIIDRISIFDIISQNSNTYFVLFSCILIFAVFLLVKEKIHFKDLSSQSIMVIVVFLIVIVSSVAFYAPWYEHETCSFSDSKYGYDDPSSKVIEDIRNADGSFYRIYKDFDSVYDNNDIPSNNDAMVQKYYGLKNYNSNCNSNYIDFLQTMGVYVACYLDIEELKSKGIEPRDVTGPSLNYINGVDDKYNLYDYLGVKYYLSKTGSEKTIPSQFVYQYSESGIDVYKNTNEYSLGFINSKYISYDEFMTYSYDERNKLLMDHTVLNDTSGMSDLPTTSSTCTTTYFTEDHVKFSVVITEKIQYVSFSIPYDKCWRVFIDGEEVNSEKINVSMLGVLVKEGVHEIELKYTPTSFINGVYISVAFLILAAIILTGYKIRRSKKNE